MKKIIDEEKRKELGNYLKKVMAEKNIGFNQLSIKTQINIKPLNEILYGRQQKINPFYLQIIAYGLKIDYKELYKIIGYLDEKDFAENSLLRKENEELKEKLSQCLGMPNVNNKKISNQVVENNSNSNLSQRFELDFEGLSEEEIIFIKSCIKFVRSKN